MGFGRAVQNTNSDALAKFVLAQMRYKKACSVSALVRFELAGSGESEEAIIKNYRATKIFKQECKLYAEARAKYIGIIRHAAAQLPRMTNEELFSLSVETNEKAIHLAVKEEAIARSITPEEIEMAKRVTAERQRVKDSFLSHENVAHDKLDTLIIETMSDNCANADEFADTMEQVVKSELDSGKIQFDPEFDKL